MVHYALLIKSLKQVRIECIQTQDQCPYNICPQLRVLTYPLLGSLMLFLLVFLIKQLIEKPPDPSRDRFNVPGEEQNKPGK